jgi:Flp pilus assembly pilin Flp
LHRGTDCKRGCVIVILPRARSPFRTISKVKAEKRDAMEFIRSLWREQDGQDIAEYAVMLAVILVIVVGTIRLIGSNASNVFSNVASSIQ